MYDHPTVSKLVHTIVEYAQSKGIEINDLATMDELMAKHSLSAKTSSITKPRHFAYKLIFLDTGACLCRLH